MTSQNLSPAKRALLEKWQQGSLDNSTTIPRRPENGVIKISLPQQRHLFLELLERGTPVNNLSIVLQLNGCLDIAAFKKSAGQIVARHEILRTRFSFQVGTPVPEISNHCD